jgi:hypothetical protein
VHDPAAFWLAKAQDLPRPGRAGDPERAREAFPPLRPAGHRPSPRSVLQLLQELKQSRLTVQHATERAGRAGARGPTARAEPVDGGGELAEVEQTVARSLDDMALSEGASWPRSTRWWSSARTSARSSS